MKSLVLYDSNYGNTEKLALVIAAALPEASAIKADTIQTDKLKNIDVLVVGSPTNGGRATEELQKFLNELPDSALLGVKVAAFDTRFALQEHGLGLKLLMKTIGFAAEKIASILESKGGIEVTKPEGFIVEDKTGPLAPGELERAKIWARGLLGVNFQHEESSSDSAKLSF